MLNFLKKSYSQQSTIQSFELSDSECDKWLKSIRNFGLSQLLQQNESGTFEKKFLTLLGWFFETIHLVSLFLFLENPEIFNFSKIFLCYPFCLKYLKNIPNKRDNLFFRFCFYFIFCVWDDCRIHKSLLGESKILKIKLRRFLTSLLKWTS